MKKSKNITENINTSPNVLIINKVNSIDNQAKEIRQVWMRNY